MADFDIVQFANFQPPQYLCPRCLGLTIQYTAEESLCWPENWGFDIDSEPHRWICPTCKLAFASTDDCNDVHKYLRRWGCFFENNATHWVRVARAAETLEDAKSLKKSSLKSLLALFNTADHFIHFVTWGLAWEFIGLLAFLSHRVQVRGVISNCDEAKAERLRQAHSYAGEHFEVIALRPSERKHSPHQKLIVVDGLVAITGSLNFTAHAWEKLDKGLEEMRIVTRPVEVMKRNNMLLSPIWARLHAVPSGVVAMKFAGRKWAETL